MAKLQLIQNKAQEQGSSKLEKSVESFLKKMIPMHLKEEFPDLSFSKDDVKDITEISVIAVQEASCAIVSGVAIGYACGDE